MQHSFLAALKKTIAPVLFIGVCAFGAFVPNISHAATLAPSQITAILDLLRAFNVDAAVIADVSADLGASVVTAPVIDPPASTTPAYVPPPIVDSPYKSSSLGYDISFNTQNYPQTPFGFAVIGATAGKSFTRNPRLASEFSWARMSSVTAPTIYLNVNAPYGSTATTAVLSSPRACNGDLFGATTTSEAAGGTFPEPTLCASYNYGYNAAKDAYTYASSQPYVSATFWWLDIEEANSWSADTAVNDQVIQGAIDYLNAQRIRVGIYSVPYMWTNIAGKGFTPNEVYSGAQSPVPTWFPIGIDTQIGATNECRTRPSFIPGSPVWIIQYELSSVAVDQNIAC